MNAMVRLLYVSSFVLFSDAFCISLSLLWLVVLHTGEEVGGQGVYVMKEMPSCFFILCLLYLFIQVAV